MYSNGYVGGTIGVSRGAPLRGKFAIIEGFGSKSLRPSTYESSGNDFQTEAQLIDRLDLIEARKEDARGTRPNVFTNESHDFHSEADQEFRSPIVKKWVTGFRRQVGGQLTFAGVTTIGMILSLCLPIVAELIRRMGSEISQIPNDVAYAASKGLATISPPSVREILGISEEVVDKKAAEKEIPRPGFVYEHPYVSSSYYTSTKSINTLISTEEIQVRRNVLQQQQKKEDQPPQREINTRLAIVRPFCEFDAEALPTTFTCWNALPPCKAAQDDLGDEYDDYEPYMTEYQMGDDGEFRPIRNKTIDSSNGMYSDFFDSVGSDAMKSATADVFLFYSQTFSENDVAIKAVDTIIDQFFEPGGWSQCFENIYAIEANIPQELDLYIPSAQEELYNWVNGPNRQFEAAFRIIQSGEWGEYDGFYLMEGDSVPIKAHWLDVVLSEIEVNRPFAILGA